MFLFGILLLGAAGAFAGLLVAYNSGGGPDYTVTMFGNSLGTLNSLDVFLAGIALTLVFCLGVALVGFGGVARRRRAIVRRTERRELAQARAEREAMATRSEVERDEDDTVVTAQRDSFTPPAKL